MLAYAPPTPVGEFLRLRWRRLQSVGRELEVLAVPPRWPIPLQWSLVSIINDHRWGYLLAVPLGACLLAGLESRRARWVGLLVLLWPAAQLVESYCMTRYFAPLVPALILGVVLGLRWVRWRVPLMGRPLVMVAIAIIILWHAWSLGTEARGPRSTEPAAIAGQLPTGNHLVFVRYPPAADGQGDWVYNEPDIDASRIVWARDMGDANVRLIRYYPQRQPWLYNVATHSLNPIVDAQQP
jgi:hypothetical protein